MKAARGRSAPSHKALLLLLLSLAAAATAAAADSADADSAANPAAADDPWLAPVLGFRDLSEGRGKPSAESGGLGITPPVLPQVGFQGETADVHTLILTDCAKYQDWQTIAAAFSWRESGQPGNVTRVVNCSPQETAAYGKVMMEVLPTFWARQYAYNAKIKDWYAAYNKPGAVVDFLAKAPAREKWVVALDSDMLLHKPFLPEMFNLTDGWAVGAAGYTYLKGVHNDLAMRHVSDIPPRNDTFAGPKGRRGDQVGGPYFMSTDDMRKVAPLWLSTTLEMRQDLEAWRDSGDTSFKPGKPVWISEMYGYAFGAARAGVWHRSLDSFMLYPSYTPGSVPHVIHYGLHYQLDGWEFDKHHYFDFDPFKCPPWSAWQGYDVPRLRGLAGEALQKAREGVPPKPAVEHPKEGIFPPPPHPARAANDTKPYLERYRDLISILTVATVNAALCEFHAATCPWSKQLEAVCGDSWELYHDVREAVAEVEWSWGCADHSKQCAFWAEKGECEKSKAYMEDHCAPSCGKCKPKEGEYVPRERTALRFAARPAEGEGEGEAAAGGGGGAGGKEGDMPPKDAWILGVDEKQGGAGGGDGTEVPAVKEEGGFGGGGKRGVGGGGGGAAASLLSDSQLRARYPAAPAASTFASLARRCSTAFDPPLDDKALAVCVRAATLRLEFLRGAADEVKAAAASAAAGGGNGFVGSAADDAAAAAATDADTARDPSLLRDHAGGPRDPAQALRAAQALVVARGIAAERAVASAVRKAPARVLLEVAAVVAAFLALGALALRKIVSRRGGARLPVGGGAYVQLLKPTGGHRSD